MADESVVRVETPTYAGVSVEHPRIVDTIKQCAKQGMSKEQAMKITGMPMVVVDKHYQNVKK
jgi:hypothetical protein